MGFCRGYDSYKSDKWYFTTKKKLCQTCLSPMTPTLWVDCSVHADWSAYDPSSLRASYVYHKSAKYEIRISTLFYFIYYLLISIKIKIEQNKSHFIWTWVIQFANRSWKEYDFMTMLTKVGLLFNHVIIAIHSSNVWRYSIAEHKGSRNSLDLKELLNLKRVAHVIWSH